MCMCKWVYVYVCMCACVRMRMFACTHKSVRMFRSSLDRVRESLPCSQEEHTALQSYTTIRPCAVLHYAVMCCLSDSDTKVSHTTPPTP